MQKLRSILPAEIQSILVRMLGALILLSLSRIIFYFVNSDSFPDVGLADWLYGMWFDLVTLCLGLLPYFIVAAAPISLHDKRWYRIIENLLFSIPVLVVLAFNFIDTQYFHFTQKRSTADFFSMVGTGNDVNQLLGTFIKEFWWLILLFLVLAAAFVRFVRKTGSNRFSKTGKRNYLVAVPGYVLLIAVAVLCGRGGWNLKPLSVIDATLFTEPQKSALVLNSGFTIIKTWGKSDLQEKKYYTPAALSLAFNPVHRTNPQHILPDGTNVMIIILEGIGQEYIGTYNDTTSYTPFIDSLLTKSWHFKYAMANGKKSIEGIPAITGGIPTFMDNPYISSSFAGNKINTLPSMLKENGYSSGFYHGATNGSMRFNSYAKQAGYDNYLGRKEYNNEQHADVTWGILDEYFEPWTAKQLSNLKEPFCGTMFTLSSHHPWFVPEKWRNKLPKGPIPICQSIAYGDLSLRLFFEEAKKQPWYDNTLFVIVADHSNPSYSDVWSQRTNMYKIPIVFFHPSGKLPVREEKEVFQQIDIMPTVLDLLNIKASYWSIGHSWFSREPHEATAYLEGAYYYFRHGRMLAFASDKPVSVLNFLKIELTPKKLPLADTESTRMTKRLKGIIQAYNHDLMHNEMTDR